MPGEACYLSVDAHHPDLGAFFTANFKGRRSTSAHHSDTADLSILLRCVYCLLTGIEQERFAGWAILLRMQRQKNVLDGYDRALACLATCGSYDQDCMRYLT